MPPIQSVFWIQLGPNKRVYKLPARPQHPLHLLQNRDSPQGRPLYMSSLGSVALYNRNQPSREEKGKAGEVFYGIVQYQNYHGTGNITKCFCFIIISIGVKHFHYERPTILGSYIWSILVNQAYIICKLVYINIQVFS